MTSQQIHYVLTLAEEKNFSKAAAKLYITQPSLSQFIQKLERELGISLFDRSTTPLKLTEAGQIYVEAAKKINGVEEDFLAHIYDLNHLEKGFLHIGSSPFRTANLLPKSIHHFCQQYPGIDVKLIEEDEHTLKNALKNGEIDILIGSGDFPATDYHTEFLAQEQLYLAVSEQIALPSNFCDSKLTAEDIQTHSTRAIFAKPVSLNELNGLNFIFSSQGEFGLSAFSPIFQYFKYKPHTTLTVQSLDSAFNFASIGFGATIVPSTLIQYGNINNHPAYYPLPTECSTRDILLVTRKSAYLSQASIHYCKVLKELIDYGTWRL